MESYLLIEYPTCSTCQKAKKWLEEKKVSYQARHIVEECPTIEELEKWIARSGLEIKKFFNTSGMVYRKLDLTNKLPNLSDREKIRLLSTNGMLIKRPLLIGEDFVLVGFKPAQWEEVLQKK